MVWTQVPTSSAVGTDCVAGVSRSGSAGKRPPRGLRRTEFIPSPLEERGDVEERGTRVLLGPE